MSVDQRKSITIFSTSSKGRSRVSIEISTLSLNPPLFQSFSPNNPLLFLSPHTPPMISSQILITKSSSFLLHIRARIFQFSTYQMVSNKVKRHASAGKFVEEKLRMPRESVGNQGDGLLPYSNTDTPPGTIQKTKSLPAKDRKAFFILTVLYLLQGVPVGLAFGSVPFLLKEHLLYSQVGIFLLAAYPYSLKLLWSPIVDAIYLRKWGRRRSWIIPIQTVSGLTLIYLGSTMDSFIRDPKNHLLTITMSFFLLVFFCATQDIAVDGWALTCISPEALSFALTAQTIGMNAGYFLSFTIFLALSSPEFANKYLRKVPLDVGLFLLGLYLMFWGWMFLLVTFGLLFVPEYPPHLANNEYNESVKKTDIYNETGPSSWTSNWVALKQVYATMAQVLKLLNVQTFVVILLLAKLGFQTSEAATNLKLLEKGLSKEDLSITVLIDFPFEIIFGYYAGRWSNGKSPLRPWLVGFAGRLVAALLAQCLVYNFPVDGQITKWYFFMIILQHLTSSFMLTIQFVSLCAFFTKIADPEIGGTYMTTLNTLSNYGGTWPRLIIYYLIDKLTYTQCRSVNGDLIELSEPNQEAMKAACLKNDGHLIFIRDGYYYTNLLCVFCGVLIWMWVKRKVAHLQSLPNSAWRIKREE